MRSTKRFPSSARRTRPISIYFLMLFNTRLQETRSEWTGRLAAIAKLFIEERGRKTQQQPTTRPLSQIRNRSDVLTREGQSSLRQVSHQTAFSLMKTSTVEIQSGALTWGGSSLFTLVKQVNMADCWSEAAAVQ